MRDTLRPSRAIRVALIQGEPGEPTSRSVRDSRVVGGGGAVLRLLVIDTGPALPWAWRGRQGPKEPCPEDRHSAVVALVSAWRPEGTPVVFRGEDEFDGTTLHEADWF